MPAMPMMPAVAAPIAIPAQQPSILPATPSVQPTIGATNPVIPPTPLSMPPTMPQVSLPQHQAPFTVPPTSQSLPTVTPATPAASPAPGASMSVPTPSKPSVIQIGAFTSSTDKTKTDQQSETEANIYLNFDNVSLSSVVNYLGEQKKINVIPHKDLEGAKVSLSTRNPLTLERAWDVMLTLLEMNGFSIIKVGSVYRIVSNVSNGQEPLPTFSSGTGTEPDQLPDNDMVIRYVYFLKNIKVETAQSILAKMIDEKNLQKNVDLNACIIKDQSLNIKAAMRIIKELDETGLRQSIEVIPLRWTGADNVKKIFDDILGTSDQQSDRIIRFTSISQKESSYFTTDTKVLPEPVKNSIILLGTQKNVDRIKNFIYKYIDVPIDDSESRLHIKELRYVRAQDIKPILEDVIRPPKGTTTEKGLVMEGGYKAFEDVIIGAEVDDDSSTGGVTGRHGSGNRLLIACNREDWGRLKSFIEKIDKPQPQVAIEVMIVDVSIGQIKSLGAQMFGIKGNPFAHNANAEFTNLTSAVPSSSSSDTDALQKSYVELLDKNIEGNEHGSYLTLGKVGQGDNKAAIRNTENVWALIKAVLSLNNSHVISQPYIIANNNQKCLVSVKTIYRLPGQLDLSKSAGQAIQQKEDVPAEIKVELTPYINLSGIIDLSIDIAVEEFASTNPTDNPARSTRKLTTKTTVSAGEVLVLGGLTNSELRESIYKTPILGDIPFIGTLFKSKKKTKNEKNLYIFMRPSIIKPRFEGAPDEYTQLKLDYAKLQIMKNDVYIHDRDPIQRWFFKPTNQTIKNRLLDASRGILRPVDDFTYGRQRPKSVNVQEDPYYAASEEIETYKAQQAAAKTEPTETNSGTPS